MSWLEETEEQFLEDSDDTDADPNYVDPVEFLESDSDSDISELRIRTQRSNTPQASGSRSRSPIAQNSYYLGKDKQTKWSKNAPPSNVLTRRRNIVLHSPGVKGVARDANSILVLEIIFQRLCY